MGEKTISDKRFGSVPYGDAKKPLQFWCRKEDWRHAIAGDPSRCGLAKAVKREHEQARTFGPRFLGAKFMKSCAVLFKTTTTGQNFATRYFLDKAARAIITGFDNGSIRPTEDIAIVLLPPSRSNKLGRKRRNVIAGGNNHTGSKRRTWKALHRGTVVMDPTAPEPKQ
jgi:hypothetical protein